MDALDGDAVWGGACGFGEGGAPGEVGVAADAEPVDRTEHDGLVAGGVEDDAFGEERGLSAFGGDNEGVTEGRAGGGRDIDRKSSESKGGASRQGGGGEEEMPS